MRKRFGNFYNHGYGNKNVEFNEPWQKEVLLRHRWWGEFGNAPDPFDIPPKYRACHIALIRGSDKKREKERRKADRKT